MTTVRYEATKRYLKKIKYGSLIFIIYNPLIFIMVFLVGATYENNKEFPVTFTIVKVMLCVLMILLLLYIILASSGRKETIYSKKYFGLSALSYMLYFNGMHVVIYFLARNDLKKLTLEQVAYYEQIHAKQLQEAQRTFESEMKSRNE